MVGLDDVAAIARTALDDIRINRALRKVADAALIMELLCLRSEDIHEMVADDLSLFLRVRDALERRKILRSRIDADKIEVEAAVLSEGLLDLVALVLPHKTVVNKDAVQVLADRL